MDEKIKKLQDANFCGIDKKGEKCAAVVEKSSLLL